MDLVYSAAVRMVRNPHLAEDVTQNVFLALAQNARELMARPVLAGWLHRTTRNLAAKAIRSESRRRAREEEAATMNDRLPTGPDALWNQIAPQLDAALEELADPDRDALLLRYFERKSANEMAQVLGTSEEAAQKRVSRAVERLRDIFTKRGVTAATSGLMAALTASAVQAAPAGLVIKISTAAALAGTAISSSTVLAATKTIAMTTTQKIIVTATLTIAVGAGLYEAREIAQLRRQVRTIKQQAPTANEIQQLRRERDEAVSQVAALRADAERLRAAELELPRLRGEVARLLSLQKTAQSRNVAADVDDPFSQSILALAAKAGELNQQLEQRPDKKIPELQFLAEHDWLGVVRDADLQSDVGIRKALARLRSLAKNSFGTKMGRALDAYVAASQGQLPAEPAQLAPYFETPVDESILQRYEMLQTGKATDVPKETWVISEKRPVDREYDSHLYIGLRGRSGSWGTGLDSVGDPDPNWTKR